MTLATSDLYVFYFLEQTTCFFKMKVDYFINYVISTDLLSVP